MSDWLVEKLDADPFNLPFKAVRSRFRYRDGCSHHTRTYLVPNHRSATFPIPNRLAVAHLQRLFALHHND